MIQQPASSIPPQEHRQHGKRCQELFLMILKSISGNFKIKIFKNETKNSVETLSFMVLQLQNS